MSQSAHKLFCASLFSNCDTQTSTERRAPHTRSFLFSLGSDASIFDLKHYPEKCYRIVPFVLMPVVDCPDPDN